MKYKFKNLNIDYILFLAIILIKVAEGAIDNDYYWQTVFGREELLNHNFTDLVSKVIWGTTGVDTYYDHEWIFNIFVYVLSLLPFGMYITKFIISLLFCYISILFIKRFAKYEFTLNIESIIVFILLNSLTIHIKAYTISVIFLFLELILLFNYTSENFNKSLLLSCLLVILWMNIHGGSVLIYFGVAGFWYLLYRKDVTKKFLLIGLVNIFCLFINPYGYKLILYNFKHILVTQTEFNQEFAPLDATNYVGCTIIILFILLIWHLRKLDYENKQDLFFILFSLLMLFICARSMRHFIYVYICFLYMYGNTKDQFTLSIFDNSFKKTITMVFILASIFIMYFGYINNFRSTYLPFFSEELEKIILDNGEENLYVNAYLSVLPLGIRDFAPVGAFTPERCDDCVILYDGCADSYTEYVIKKYQVTKFLICNKDSSEPRNNGGYSSTYMYFKSHSDSYKFLYEDEDYSYVIKK